MESNFNFRIILFTLWINEQNVNVTNFIDLSTKQEDIARIIS